MYINLLIIPSLGKEGKKGKELRSYDSGISCRQKVLVIEFDLEYIISN